MATAEQLRHRAEYVAKNSAEQNVRDLARICIDLIDKVAVAEKTSAQAGNAAFELDGVTREQARRIRELEHQLQRSREGAQGPRQPIS